MGIRGELYSTKVSLQNRTYFFNVKENRLGDLYLNIVESKNKDTGGFERQSLVLFSDDLTEFLKGFEDSLKVMEKASREKRKAGHDKSQNPNDTEGRSNQDARRPAGAAPDARKPKRTPGSSEGRKTYRKNSEPNAPDRKSPERKGAEWKSSERKTQARHDSSPQKPARTRTVRAIPRKEPRD